MAKARVPLWQQPSKFVVIDTAPAVVGVNVFLPDGSLFDPSKASAQPVETGGLEVTVWGAIQNKPANIVAVENLGGTGVVQRAADGTLSAAQLDHGALAGLADDDHPQYLNNARGDARYAPVAHVGSGGAAHAAATTSVAGFMSAADKTKLDGVAAGATATPLSSTTPAALGAAAVGTGTTAARADHVHPLPTPAAIGAAPASHTHTASQISDSTVTGRALITAADAAAGRTALGLGTAAVENIGTSGATVPRLNGSNTHSGTNNFTGNVGINQASPQRRVHIVGVDGSGGALPASVGARAEVVYENSGNANFAIVIPSASSASYQFTRYGGTTSGGIQYFGATNIVRIEANLLGAALDLTGTALTYNNTLAIWHAGNSAQVVAGTIEGQLARWNNVAGRYEPITAAGLVNAANDAAAAGAGVPVSGIYRNGSVLQIRVS